jgi:hypothetical protein
MSNKKEIVLIDKDGDVVCFDKYKNKIVKDHYVKRLIKKEDLITLLPKMTLSKWEKSSRKPSTLFYYAYECPALGYLWLFAGWDTQKDFAYGWVKMYEGEWGVIDYETFSDTVLRLRGVMTAFPMVETFKDGPKSVEELNKMFYGYKIE